MKKFLLGAMCLLALGACTAKNGVTQDNLINRRFVIQSLDGKPFPTTMQTPEIEFGEGLRVFGAVCNRYTGQGELKDSVLTVRQMASTKMLCADDALNAFEQQFSNMLMAGAAVELDNDTLTLKQGGNTAVFVARPKTQ